MYSKLIVPLDGSEKAEGVLPFVGEITEKFNSEIILIGVSAEHSISIPRLLGKYVKNLAGQLSNKGAKTKTILLQGNPGKEIIKYANNNRDGILVMANYGGSGSSHWLLGDLIGKIALRTVIPLLLIPEKWHTLGQFSSRFKRILIPLDTSPDGEAALPFAIELAKKANSRVFLLHVIPAIHKLYGLPDYAIDFERQLFVTLHQQGEEYLKGITSRLLLENLETKYEFMTGAPVEGILTYAEQHLSDLIAISAHGHSGITRFDVGSVARQVMFSSDIPVLLVRAIGRKSQGI
jgi:nucleotide-binding universal stress UspA family protein